MEFVSLQSISEAAERIDGLVHRTPIMRSEQLDRLCEGSLFFKCENLQKVGAFKARGAANAVFSLQPEQLEKGVATHSSGNHAAALARAAALRNCAAHIVMPRTAPQVKKDAVAGYGGIIVECDPTLQSRETTLAEVVAETGAEVVHPFADSRVVAGQGTVALEILDQLDELDMVVVPVGGGGLLSGVATAIKALRPEIEVMAAEPAGADDAFRSFGMGRRIPVDTPDTIADGLLTSVGEPNFEVMMRCVDTVVTVEDSSIVEAMKWQWSRLKTVVEPSGAVTFAAVLEHPERFRGRRSALVISGGNVDLQKLPF